MNRRQFMKAGVATLGSAQLAGLPSLSWGNGYPSGPIRVVIPFPAGLGSFEDISVSSDGLYALATGNNGTNLGLMRAPFTTAGATSCQIPVTGGRGAGAVRFLPPGLQPPPPPPPNPNIIVPTNTPAGLAVMALLLAMLGAFGLRRLRR